MHCLLTRYFFIMLRSSYQGWGFFKVEGSNELHEQNLREDLTLTLLKRFFSMLKKLCVDKNICIPLVKHYVFECEVSLNCIHFKTLNFTLNKNSSESILFFHWELFPPWKFPIFLLPQHIAIHQWYWYKWSHNARSTLANYLARVSNQAVTHAF